MFFSKQNHKLLLLLEIQSSLVRGSLVLAHESDPPQVLFTQSFDVPYKPSAPTSYYVKTTLRDLNELIEIVLRNLHVISRGDIDSEVPHHVSEVHYILSSPWVVSQAKTVSISYDSVTMVTQEKLNKIIQAERDKASFDKKIEMETIEEKIFDVRLNGYSITAWRGKEVEELEISYALSVGSRESVNALRDVASHAAKTRKIFFHSSLLLQYISLRNAVIPDDSYTLVHVHGELTDLVVVKHGLCSFFGSFPMGINTIMRKIGEATNTDRKTAESLITLYLGNHIDDSSTQKAGIVINSMARSWANELGGLWTNGSGGETLPESVFIIARAHEDFFSQSFRSIHPQAKIGKLAVDMISTYALAIHNIQK